MSQRLVYFNGDFIPEQEARISIFDSALLFGDMVFEVTRTFNQKPFRLREHLERLYGSIRYAEIDCGLTIDEMEAATYETIEKNLPALNDLDFQIMHDVTRGGYPLYEGLIKEGASPIVSINVFPLIRHVGGQADKYETGSHFVITPQQSVPSRYIDPKAKNRSRIFYKLAELHASKLEEGAMALLTDEHGFITEGTGNNFFIARDGEIFTSKPNDILRGVSRHACMDHCLLHSVSLSTKRTSNPTMSGRRMKLGGRVLPSAWCRSPVSISSQSVMGSPDPFICDCSMLGRKKLG